MANPTLQQVHIQAALGNLSIAYRQERPPVSDRLFPRVMVAKQSDKFFVWNKGDMWRAEAKLRAPGALFPRAGIRLSSDDYRAEQYTLEYEIPDEISANADAGVAIEETATMFITDQLSLAKDLRFATDFFTTGAGWTSGTVGTAWDNAASGTPISAITGAVQTITDALGGSAGSHRIVGLGGTKIRTALLNSAAVRDTSKYVRESTIASVDAALAGVLGLDELIIDGRQQNTAKEGRAASYSPLFDNDFLVVAVPRAPGLMTPAAGYTFAWSEGGRGDTYVEMYRDEIKKQDVVRGITYFDQVQTGADLGVFFSNPVT
jgi:hypothetical protein